MKKCIVCGKEYKYLKKGMCPKHYEQHRKYGEYKRTKNDLNEIVEYEDHAEIVLYNKNCEEVARALIDLEDIEKVKQYKWSLNEKWYVKNTKNKLRLHRIIMDCPDDMMVDHINHNPLDNRKSNLRICTVQQNNMNTSLRNDNTSGHKGVVWDKSRNKWLSRIKIDGNNKYLGRFDTKEEAVEARKQAEIDYFGDYRNKEDEEN